jgi:hypothetical protein
MLQNTRFDSSSLYWLNIDSRELVFENKAKGLDKNNIQVGDFVGFYNQKLAEDMTGCVEHLNPKTVTVMTAKGRWRVSYRLLCSVIDGQKIEELKSLD